MGYILVQPEVLLSKGINHFQTIPDGRAIAEMRMLKVLGSLSSVDIISSSSELKRLIENQKAAGIGQETEVTEDMTVVDESQAEEVVTDAVDEQASEGDEEVIEEVTEDVTEEDSDGNE